MHNWIGLHNFFIHLSFHLSLAEFILGTNYPSEINLLSETDKLSPAVGIKLVFKQIMHPNSFFANSYVSMSASKTC